MVSAAFKIEFPGIYEINEIQLPSTGPHISFVGRIYSIPEQQENDCLFGIHLFEYNNLFLKFTFPLSLKLK